MKTAYVILISRKDGKPFYEEDNFCGFDDPVCEDGTIQITYNKALVEERCKEYNALDSRTYMYTVKEVEIK